MTRYRFTPQALSDLFDIWSYIAQDNPQAADRVEGAIYDRLRTSREVALRRHGPQGPDVSSCAFLAGTAVPELFYRV
jgi:plasmid stabilization system protein ParE